MLTNINMLSQRWLKMVEQDLMFHSTQYRNDIIILLLDTMFIYLQNCCFYTSWHYLEMTTFQK